MATSGEQLPAFNSERFWRIYRNWNAVASVAFAGANVIFPGSQLIAIGLGWNIGQTIFGELMRQNTKSRKNPRTAFAH